MSRPEDRNKSFSYYLMLGSRKESMFVTGACREEFREDSNATK